MKKLCMPRVLKNISYILFPILFASLILIIFCLSYPLEKESIKENIDFYDTNTFAEDYANQIFESLTVVEALKQEGQENEYTYYYTDYYHTHTENVENNDNVDTIRYYSNYFGTNMTWLVIDNNTKIAYTNLNYSLDTSTLENIINKIMSNQNNWKYEDGNIETTIDKLSNENIEYIDSGLNREEEGIIENENNTEKTKNDYTIYTSLLDEMEYVDDIYIERLLYNTLSLVNENFVFLIPFLIILMIVLVPIIIKGIGRTGKQEGIYLNWYDKILIELAALIAIFIGGIGATITISINSPETVVTFVLEVSVIIVGLFILYMACILLFETIVKRIKTHTLIKTTIAYWLYTKLKDLSNNIKTTKKLILYFILFACVNLFGFSLILIWSERFLGLALTIALYAITFGFLYKRVKSYSKISKTINDLYKGNTDIHLSEDELCKEMKETGKEINDIAGGLSNAIEEKLKSERLKTELITNVSHDIKTPLTSIINYVDLLKKEGTNGEKAKEYLDILDSKSQRLKKLTEDLVEASKASSGAIKFNIEKLNVNELIKQISGEFEDKFKSHKLQEIITLPERDVYINADSRYMYRVLENMYSNISKYAMEGTRVYTDIIENDKTILIQLKNVSKQKLNISVDELMQRFVRGEASRNTEGSGLGLSIARSLTELQEGSFNIYLDGDLFKVIIEFKKK